MQWCPSSLIFGNGFYDLIASLAKVGGRRARFRGDLENAQDHRDRTYADTLPNASTRAGFDMERFGAKNTAQPSAPCAASS